MTCGGSTSSMEGSFAVPVESARFIIRRPGPIAPPRNSDLAEITPYVVAVPKSMKIAGPP